VVLDAVAREAVISAALAWVGQAERRPSGARLGPVRLISGLFGFWSVLSKAAGLSHASLATFAGTPRT